MAVVTINLCADTQAVFAEIIQVPRPVPIDAVRDIDLWTGSRYLR